MSLKNLGILVLVAGLLPISALAQQTTTVQLPVFNFTTVQTTVSVPDGGTGLLGGVNRASEGSVSRGVPLLGGIPGLGRLFKNRGIGRDVGSTNMSVIPRIIVMEEEELLQTGVSAETLSAMSASSTVPNLVLRSTPVGTDPALARQAQFLGRNIARHDPAKPADGREAGLASVDEIRRSNELAKASRASEAEEYFAKAMDAEQRGADAVARVFYQMAARRADGEMLHRVGARLAAMSDTPTGVDLVTSQP